AAAVALKSQGGELAAVWRTAADLGDEQIAFYHGGAADAKKVGDDAEIGHRIHSPEELAIGCLDAMQHPLGSVDVDAIAVHDSAAGRTVVVAVGILIVGGVIELPKQLSSFAVETAQPVAILVAIEEEEPAAADRRGAVAAAHAGLPHEPQPFLRP